MGQLTRGHRRSLRTAPDQLGGLAGEREAATRGRGGGRVERGLVQPGRQDPLQGRVLGAVVEERGRRPAPAGRADRLAQPAPAGRSSAGPRRWSSRRPISAGSTARSPRLARGTSRGRRAGPELVGRQVGQRRQAVPGWRARSWVATSWWSAVNSSTVRGAAAIQTVWPTSGTAPSRVAPSKTT